MILMHQKIIIKFSLGLMSSSSQTSSNSLLSGHCHGRVLEVICKDEKSEEVAPEPVKKEEAKKAAPKKAAPKKAAPKKKAADKKKEESNDDLFATDEEDDDLF
jgi:hypothetical protein